MPWVIKPAAEGSSVGVAIVRNRRQMNKALETAFQYDDRIIIEKYIPGKEIHIGILNNAVLGGVGVRPSLEFYSYEAKYTSGLTEYILPPVLDRKSYTLSKRLALASHKALQCGGATRVDLRVNNRGNPFVLEVNTIPGMTETSLLPKIAKQAGIEFPDLLEKILAGAFYGQ
jgi:D-alanine-D-alanine ligase